MSVPVPSWWIDWRRHRSRSKHAPFAPLPTDCSASSSTGGRTQRAQLPSADRNASTRRPPRPTRRQSTETPRASAPSQPRPTPPTDRASPFPEVTDPFCRLPLVAFFRLTRGYAPWRPAAVIGTDCAKEEICPLAFHGLSTGHRTEQNTPLFPTSLPVSPHNAIPQA